MTPARVLPWIAVVVLGEACATVHSEGRARPDPLDHATITRCQYAIAGGAIGDAAVDALAGRYRLYMTSDAEPADQTTGLLELRSGPRGPDPDVPRLIGTADIDPSSVGAVVPGALASTDASAPGVGAYVFAPDPTRPAEVIAVLRMGAESNRRDRQRFDGAHTTLRITLIADDRFGGTWSSAEGATAAGGGFCAIRR